MLYIFILYRNTRRHINNMSPEKKTTFVMAIHGKRHGCSSHIDNRYRWPKSKRCQVTDSAKITFWYRWIRLDEAHLMVQRSTL